MTRFAGLYRVLNGPDGYNRSMANAAVLESFQRGQNYSFFRSAGGSPLCAAIDIVYGNATVADQFGLDQAWASPYAATMRRLVLAVTRIVSEGLGGSGYDESVAQFSWSFEMLGLACQVIDNPSLGAQVTGSQRAEVFNMSLKVLAYYTDAPYQNFGSFGAIFHQSPVINMMSREVASDPSNTYVTAAQVERLRNYTCLR
jgi:hypothetical protein